MTEILKTKRPVKPSRRIYEDILATMTDLKKHYANSDEYKAILMNLSSAAKAVNEIQIKEITENDQKIEACPKK